MPRQYLVKCVLSVVSLFILRAELPPQTANVGAHLAHAQVRVTRLHRFPHLHSQMPSPQCSLLSKKQLNSFLAHVGPQDGIDRHFCTPQLMLHDRADMGKVLHVVLIYTKALSVLVL